MLYYRANRDFKSPFVKATVLLYRITG